MSADHPVEHGVGGLQVTDGDLSCRATDLFYLPPVDRSMVKGKTVRISPIDKANDGPFKFELNSANMEYIKMDATRLYLMLRVTREDGTNLAANENVAFVNTIGTALFSNIDIEIGGVPHAALSNTHVAYKGYLETLMSYSKGALATHMKAGQFDLDEPEKYDNLELGDAGNQAFLARKEICATSQAI